MKVMGLEKVMAWIRELGEYKFMDRSTPASGGNNQDVNVFVYVLSINQVYRPKCHCGIKSKFGGFQFIFS